MSTAPTEVDVIEVYVHRPGSYDPELVSISLNAQVKELAGESKELEVDLLWLEDADEPLDLEMTIGAVGIGHRHHVHHGRCPSVAVRVRYGGEEPKERSFGPAKTVERVFEWATGKNGFELTPAEKAKHFLALPHADQPLDRTTHVGSLVGDHGCEVTLDLAPKKRFEG